MPVPTGPTNPFDEDDLEEAATVLMSGPSVAEMMDELQDLYKRNVTDEAHHPSQPSLPQVFDAAPRESESESAAFHLVDDPQDLSEETPLTLNREVVEPPSVDTDTTNTRLAWAVLAGLSLVAVGLSSVVLSGWLLL